MAEPLPLAVRELELGAKRAEDNVRTIEALAHEHYMRGSIWTCNDLREQAATQAETARQCRAAIRRLRGDDAG